MFLSILSKLGVPFILFILGLSIGGGLVYKYMDKTALIKAQRNEIANLNKANANLVILNANLKFNLDNNNLSVIHLESQIGVLEMQNDFIKKQELNAESSILKYVRINKQLVLILQNSEQSNISNTSARINAQSSATQFINPVKFTDAVSADLLRCNLYIIQLNNLIDWIQSNITYYNGLTK